jgi:hypothetical protein
VLAAAEPDAPDHPKLVHTALVAETILRRMLDKHRLASSASASASSLSSIAPEKTASDRDNDDPSSSSSATKSNKCFAPSVDNLNTVLLLLGRTGHADRAWQLLHPTMPCCRPMPRREMEQRRNKYCMNCCR